MTRLAADKIRYAFLYTGRNFVIFSFIMSGLWVEGPNDKNTTLRLAIPRNVAGECILCPLVFDYRYGQYLYHRNNGFRPMSPFTKGI